MTDNILVSLSLCPLPGNAFEWVATYEDYDGAPDAPCHPMGFGQTKSDAISDLREQNYDR